MAAGLVFYMHYGTSWLLILGTIGLLTIMFLWWRDVIKESTFQKVHTPVVELGLRYGMALFIASEVMFFVAFFWAFFDASLTPKLPIEEFSETFDSNGAVGIWPPEGIKTFDPLDVPFLNTLILLMSGTTCTWAHHAVREGHRDQAIQALWCTVGLGIFFSFMQRRNQRVNFSKGSHTCCRTWIKIWNGSFYCIRSNVLCCFFLGFF